MPRTRLLHWLTSSPGPPRRWLWRAALREPWSPASHPRFPVKFRSAARALLLALNRGGHTAAAAGSSPAGGGADGHATLLGHLPAELSDIVVAGAAYPLSAWRPTFKGGRLLKALRRLEQEYEAYLDEDVW